MDRHTLYAAAIAGDTDAILKLKIKADAVSTYDRTILHIESRAGNTERVRFILKEFENLLVKLDSNNETALHLATYNGHVKVVELLVDAATSFPYSAIENRNNAISCLEDFMRQANNKMNTALHLAVSTGNVEVAEILVKADASDKHIQNGNGDTPVYLAAKLGYNHIIKMICTICTAPSLDGPDGTTALHAAVRKLPQAEEEDNDVIMVLINAVKRSSSSKNAPYSSLETVLDLAVQGNHVNVVKLILEDPTYRHRTATKSSDLKALIYTTAERRYNDIVKLLCETYEAENSLGDDGETALHAAIIGGDADSVLTHLMKNKRLVTYADEIGWTPLHYAAKYQFDSVLGLIVETQIRAGYQFRYGEEVPTPLWVAAKEGHISTVKKLLTLLPASSHKATDHKGSNILHVAALQSDKEMIQCIFKNCPEESIEKLLHDKDMNGDTPLHLLIREGCFVENFINHKSVNPTIENNQNLTPMDMLYFHDEIIADQAQIKAALVKLASQGRWLSSRYVKGTRLMKDSKFKDEELKRKQKMLDLCRQRISNQIVVTALITTVSFTVAFTMPGGYHQSGEPDQGLVILSKKNAFIVFMISDALALTLSTSCLLFYFFSYMSQDPYLELKFNAISEVMNTISLLAMLFTFQTGTFVVLSHSPGLAIMVFLIICLCFIFVIVRSVNLVYQRKQERRTHVV